MAMGGFFAFDPVEESNVLYRVGRDVPSEEWYGESWQPSDRALYWVLDSTEVSELTVDEVRRLFPGAIEALDESRDDADAESPG